MKAVLIAVSTIGLGLTIAFAVAYTKSLNPPVIVTPLASNTSIAVAAPATTTSTVTTTVTPSAPEPITLGFLPYWNFKYHDQIQHHLITHLAVFGLTFNPNGTIATKEESYKEPGYAALTSDTMDTISRSAKASNTKLILTLPLFDADIIDTIIASPKATTTLIDEVSRFVTQYDYDGVNLDFEYIADPSPTTIANFSKFIKQFSTTLKGTHPNIELSMDIFADSATQIRPWNLPTIHQDFDHIIVMAYDYHRPSSPTVGPVAPLYGSGQLWQEDITSHLAKLSTQIPASKIVLGVPYYGYQWQTESFDHLAPSLPKTGSTVSYFATKELLSDPTTKTHWDSISLTPWLTYQEGEEIYQAYYEDVRSLSLKYDLAKQSNLAGIAIWALGYDHDHSDLWQLLSNKFPRTN